MEVLPFRIRHNYRGGIAGGIAGGSRNQRPLLFPRELGKKSRSPNYHPVTASHLPGSDRERSLPARASIFNSIRPVALYNSRLRDGKAVLFLPRIGYGADGNAANFVFNGKAVPAGKRHSPLSYTNAVINDPLESLR